MKSKILPKIVISLVVILGVVGITFLLNSNEDEKELESDMAQETIRKQFNTACFDFNESFLKYEDENYTSLQGIDVSEFDKIINFKEVKDEGIEFVIIRIGRRGYQTGELHLDKYFYKNYASAMENNLKVGVYFFSQAINQEEAIEEANFVLDTLDGLKLDIGVCYDFEEIGEEDARGDTLSKEQATKNAIAFFETIGNYGYDNYLYVSNNSLNKYFDINKLNEIPLWYAQYYKEPECTYDISCWQYSEEGMVKGMEENVDMDIMFVRKSNNK